MPHLTRVVRTPHAWIAAVVIALALAATPAFAQKNQTPDKDTKKQSAPAQTVDLNSASASQIERLPGVGRATAKKMVANRPYTSIKDLSRAGVSEGTIDRITPYVTVGNPTAATSGTTPAPDTGKKSRHKPSDTGTSQTPASPAPTPDQTRGGSVSGTSAGASQAPAKGMVWVNTATGVYHYEGDRWYGKTKQGKYMTEADAVAAGYHAAKNEKKK